MVPETLFIASALSGAGASIYQGETARKQADAEAKWADYNARVAENEAGAAAAAGQAQGAQHRKQIRAFLGRQRAGIAASGLALSGTPLEVMSETARELERENATILHEALLTSTRYRNQAAMSRYEGQMARARGKSAQRAGYLGAAGAGAAGLGDLYIYKKGVR